MHQSSPVAAAGIFLLFLSLDLDGGVVKNINAPRDRTCVRCFALCGFFSELQMERWICEQLQSLSAHSVARGPGGRLISWGTLPILVSLVFPFHYSSKYSPDFHSDFIAQQQRFRQGTACSAAQAPELISSVWVPLWIPPLHLFIYCLLFLCVWQLR